MSVPSTSKTCASSRRTSAAAMHRPDALGHLHDDLGLVAARIYRIAFDGTVDVWVDDVGTVVGAPAGIPRSVPAHWRVGTFAAGASLAEITDGLRAMREERAKDWILD